MVASRRAGALFAVIVLAFGLSGAVAGAKKKHKKKVNAWGSKVTLTHQASTQFAGVVSSNLGACVDSRVVTLTYTDPNTGQTSPLSVQRTDASGNFQVTLTTPAYSGTYQALVATRKIRARNAPQQCLDAKSVIIPL